MAKVFNTVGICLPKYHYMADTSSKLNQIIHMIEDGKYFTINRARQFGKTTTLELLRTTLQNRYLILSFNFEGLGSASFESEDIFCRDFVQFLLLRELRFSNDIPKSIYQEFEFALKDKTSAFRLSQLRFLLENMCCEAVKPIVMLIDEIDSASNNQVFLDFLAILRAQYLNRSRIPAFQSVILASVYDVKNIKLRSHPEEIYKYNSPWNIAADFTVDMWFSSYEISTMLTAYEIDYHTGMDIPYISNLLFDYTSGYPFLVSRLCQLMEESLLFHPEFLNRAAVWTKKGVLAAITQILSTPSTLFDDMVKKLYDFLPLKEMLKEMLFYGKQFSYEQENPSINLGIQFGFLKSQENTVLVSNRIFETKLYNLFLSEEETNSLSYHAALLNKNQFIENGHLNMDLVMKKFVEHFTDIYQDCTEKFIEENGRRFFLLYLKPIINGTGNYYVEARTRNLKRTDIIVDYHGEQSIIELKIWHGQEYQNRGKQQLFEYLEYYNIEKGYLLSFNFNKTKHIGIQTIQYGGKQIVEAIV